MSKIKRNDPCHCGSGKKYKKCCLRKEEEDRRFEDDLKSGFVPNSSDEDWEEESAPKPEQEACRDEAYDEEGEEFDDEPFDPEEEKEDDGEEEQTFLSKEEDQLIENWWGEYSTMKDPDILYAHVEKFLDEYPHLVTDLNLDEEPLFQLDGMYARKKRYDKYPALLNRLRTEFPEAYQQGAGYFDNSFITHLIINNRKEEVREYLGFFRQYPAE